MNLLSKNIDLSFLSSRFKNIEFQLFVSSDSISYISCITCLCTSSAQIIENWRPIQNFVSGFYQPPGELAVWNIYLAFFCVEKLPVWDKYEIENDKYAVRKLVLDGQKMLPTTTQVIDSLSEHLLGSDLVIDSSVDGKIEEISLSLNEYVRGVPLDSTAESREERARIINHLIEVLNKDEDKKS
ncbi:ABC-three component system middle component 1 [Aeromonas enteropelogenes]|uniref:ABC-three component system middle component 1 n=1 Tax=Aeromonas enteropelogenes TaxID=29489 RepID=UPI003BA11E39